MNRIEKATDVNRISLRRSKQNVGDEEGAWSYQAQGVHFACKHQGQRRQKQVLAVKETFISGNGTKPKDTGGIVLLRASSRWPLGDRFWRGNSLVTVVNGVGVVGSADWSGPGGS